MKWLFFLCCISCSAVPDYYTNGTYDWFFIDVTWEKDTNALEYQVLNIAGDDLTILDTNNVSACETNLWLMGTNQFYCFSVRAVTN